jgi:hypothetical protein
MLGLLLTCTGSSRTTAAQQLEQHCQACCQTCSQVCGEQRGCGAQAEGRCGSLWCSQTLPCSETVVMTYLFCYVEGGMHKWSVTCNRIAFPLSASAIADACAVLRCAMMCV